MTEPDAASDARPFHHSFARVGWFFLSMAVLSIGGIAVAGETGSGRRAAGQVQATSTPIRLTQITPNAAPSPTATAEAIIIVVEPTKASGSLPAELDLRFDADDWQGGYYRGDAEWYGRPWTAVYGALSDYPSATLSFALAIDPEQDLVLRVDGLDDELALLNEIAIEVNGERIFEDESPFVNWDANTSDQGADAEWTTVEITMPAELFTAGENEITVRNLSDSGNFGLPPYILLSEATLTAGE